MLKLAFELGIKKAYADEGLTPAQMTAAQQLAGLGGGVTGATAGGLLGKYLGGRAAETFGHRGLFGGMDPRTIQRGELLGALAGSLGGGALGGYAGSRVPKWLKRVAPEPVASQPVANQETSESALGLLPKMHGQTPDMRMSAIPAMDGFYPEY